MPTALSHALWMPTSSECKKLKQETAFEMNVTLSSKADSQSLLVKTKVELWWRGFTSPLLLCSSLSSPSLRGHRNQGGVLQLGTKATCHHHTVGVTTSFHSSCPHPDKASPQNHFPTTNSPCAGDRESDYTQKSKHCASPLASWHPRSHSDLVIYSFKTKGVGYLIVCILNFIFN